MTDDSKPKSTRAAASALKERFAGLASSPPAAPAETPAPAPAAPASGTRTRAPRRKTERAAAMPAEQSKPPAWDQRISLTASGPMKRALELARIEDGIEATARIRAMITLWQEDERLRKRIDKLARDLR